MLMKANKKTPITIMRNKEENSKTCRSFATCNVYDKVTRKKLGKGVSHQRKIIIRPVKVKKVGKKKKAECVSNHSTPTEQQQSYFNSELRSVGPLILRANVGKTVHFRFAEDVINTLVEKTCRKYACKTKRPNCKDPTPFYAISDHDFTESELTLDFVHKNLVQKHLTTAII